MDPYVVLGIGRDASREQIRSAYRALVKKEHPDTGEPFDVERFRAIRQAYEMLVRPNATMERPPAPASQQHPVSWTGGFHEPMRPFQEVAGPSPGAPVHLDIVLSAEEAVRGVRVRLEIPLSGPCGECDGTGSGFFGWCSACAGSGRRRGRETVLFAVPSHVEHGTIVRAATTSGRALMARVRVSR